MKSRNDSTKHHRRSIRLRDYDYASPGAYFVTMVTVNRAHVFADDVYRRIAEWNWKAIPRHFERVTLDAWVVMPNHVHGIIVITDESDAARGGRGRGEAFTAGSRRGVALVAGSRRGEAFVNGRFRGEPGRDIPIEVSQNQDLTNASPQPAQPPQTSQAARGVPPGALGAVVGNFKSVTTRRINRFRHTCDVSVWQVNYYEHIVRNEGEWDRIREYVAANPSRWAYDRENRSGLAVTDEWLEDEQSWFCKSNLKSSHA